jgi:triacylglycerol lipase
MKRIYTVFAILVSIAVANSGLLFPGADISILWKILAFALFVAINIVPGLEAFSLRTDKLKQCSNGAELLIIYLFSSVACLVIWVAFLFTHIIPYGTEYLATWLFGLLWILVLMSVLYWNGIIRLMIHSTQVGIFYKTYLYFIGWLFPVNVIILPGIVKRAIGEARFENGKILLNEQRHMQQICRTRYPLLMVHGVFFRDFKPAFLNYWGRISGELTLNGATIFYGNQQSAASVENCGKELADRIRTIVSQTGCQKVNVIAHSKGGLDTRAAIARYGVEDMVASLTTINTPHRGCEFADYLLGKFGQGFKDTVAGAYNAALSKLGDHDPNFIEAVTDLTHEACTTFNARTPDSPKVFYQSVGTYMKHSSGGRFPLNFSYHLVKHFDGRNDGLVGEKSFGWGQKFTFIEPTSERGISHGDMIDLNKENIDGFDVREFYVQLVSDLRTRGF